MTTLEQIQNSNKKYIIGIDECGTGSLCGDVYVCAYMAPKEWMLDGLNDSKQLSEKKRNELYNPLIGENYREDYKVVKCHPNDKEKYKEFGDNLHGLLRYLYHTALRKFFLDYPSFWEIRENILIVLDGNMKFSFHDVEVISLPKADSLIPQVMAASVIGKVERDAYITKLGNKFPDYNWAKNKGYSTKEHLEALKKFGYCDEHRVSFEPIKSMVK
jgi:ribonuclease HII